VGRYIATRLVMVVPVMLAVSIIVFGMMQIAPGDPAQLLAGVDADAQDIAAIRDKYNLDQPFYVQYASWLGNVLQGDLGRSMTTRRAVSDEIASRFIPTSQLAVFATTLAILAGTSIGVLSAHRHNTLVDYVTMVLALIGASMPAFWLGLMLILFFAVRLQWLPTSRSGGLSAIVLPGLTLAASATAVIARMTRSSVLEVNKREYVRTARSKGLSEGGVLKRHILQNAMIPVLTVIGLQFGHLLGGTVVTETVFARPGLGRLLVDGIKTRDFPVVQGTLLVLAFAFVIVNLLVDISYSFLDPRIRRGR
jgi:peptide/nickel transport system permease protein